MNNSETEIFTRDIAESYDAYYETDAGKRIDELEKAAVDSLLENVPRGKLLEIGCGTGHWTAHFAERGFGVTAVDASEAMLAVARRRGLFGVEFRAASAERLPFGDATFDAAAGVTVFEFVSDIGAAFREIRRILRPGGWFVGGFLNADSELARRSAEDPVIGRGRLLTRTRIGELLSTLGTAAGKDAVHSSKPDAAEFRECVRFSPSMEARDGFPDAERYEPAFIAARIRKATP